MKTLGLSEEGLKLFYTSNVRSLTCYAAPAWYTVLSDFNKQRLESIQRYATRIILPEFNYEERLESLDIPLLNDFLFHLASAHFSKILHNSTHPHHYRIILNTSQRTSSRASYPYLPKRCRTTKRQNSFFQFFMSFYNNRFVYVE